MSQNNQNLDSKGLEEKIQVYDNDDAYVFGELPENNVYDYSQENENINNMYDNKITNNINYNDNKNLNNNNEIFNNLNFENIDNNQEENKKDNNYNIEINDLNKNIKNINLQGIQDITFNKKFSINEIDSEIDNKEKNFNKIKSQDKLDKPVNNDNYNNNEEIDNYDDSNDANIPLVTLNFLSICQCCKDPFNSNDCIPFLFKCGHFFCKKCILEQFIDDEGIKCPNDGLVAKSISELKILNNFITDKTVTQRTNNSNTIYCNIHKGQKLTHYIEETKELICVYCAFEKFKHNPNWEIKEINDKFKEIETEIDKIIDENQKNVGIIKNNLNEIKKNKEIEEKKVTDVFNRLDELIKLKKEENLSKINTLFTENAKKLSQKLEMFSNKIEKSEEIKEKISSYKENKEQSQLANILNDFNKLLAKINDNHYYKLILQKYKFIYEDESVITRLINKFGDFKIYPNNCMFLGNKKNNITINNNSTITHSNNNINSFKNNLNCNNSTSKLNINQSQSRMNINIFTNINPEKSSSVIDESNNIIKRKLKINKSNSSKSPFQKNKNKINNNSNSQYNFYKQKMIEPNINQNSSNINSINIYNNYKNNSKPKGTQKKKKLNNTLDYDININKKKNINNSVTGIRVNTPGVLNQKSKLNTGIYFGNKYDLLNNSPNIYEKKLNKLIVNQSGNSNLLNKGNIKK